VTAEGRERGKPPERQENPNPAGREKLPIGQRKAEGRRQKADAFPIFFYLELNVT
jgi:hypothetical protein